MKETEPSRVLPMWGNGLDGPGRASAFRAGAFGRDRSPLPLATNSVPPSGLTARADGYQPTGTNPSTTEMVSAYCFARSSSVAPEMSTTMTSLLSALATNSVRPSGETARASGVLPSGDWGYSDVEITSRGASQSRRTGLA